MIVTKASSLAAVVSVIALIACSDRARPVATAPEVPMTRAALSGPVLGSDGRCQGPSPVTATAIEPGIGECDLVRLKGKTPTDVLIGESGKGQREVQVLYFEPGARELYLFIDNRLDRIIR